MIELIETFKIDPIFFFGCVTHILWFLNLDWQWLAYKQSQSDLLKGGMRFRRTVDLLIAVILIVINFLVTDWMNVSKKLTWLKRLQLQLIDLKSGFGPDDKNLLNQNGLVDPDGQWHLDGPWDLDGLWVLGGPGTRTNSDTWTDRGTRTDCGFWMDWGLGRTAKPGRTAELGRSVVLGRTVKLGRTMGLR